MAQATEGRWGVLVTLVIAALLLAPGVSALPLRGIAPAAWLTRPVVASVGCTPPGSGDWVISTSVSCVGEDLVLAGNLLVQSGGTLELSGTTVSFDSPAADGYDLHALAGATLYLNDSALHSTQDTTFFALLVDAGVTFGMHGTEVIGAGWNDLELYAGAPSGQAYVEYGRYLWLQAPATDRTFTSNDGIEISSTPTDFWGNTFDNYTHLRFYADDVVVAGNTFSNFKHEALAFLDDLQRVRVTNNTFRDATRMDRNIHGVVLYTNVTDVEIADNDFSWVPSGILVADRGPWYACRDVRILHNDFRNVIFGYRGRIEQGTISNNTFDGIMQAMSIDSTQRLVVEDNVMRNITFQQALEGVIDQDYYNAVDGRGLLPNLAYWMWGFYCSKFIVNLSWYTRDVVLRRNHFADAPPYTMALNTDQAQGLQRVQVLENTFENIGTYIPSGYHVRRDTTGHNDFSNVTPISGAAVMLEGSDAVVVANNTFLNVTVGVTTSAPDALGNFGGFRIEHNLFLGVGPFAYDEERLGGSWWGGAFAQEDPGIGVATSMNYISPGGSYNWSAWIGTTYEGDSTQRITNNTFSDFTYPLIVDYRRQQPSAANMGLKTALVRDNLVLSYGAIQTYVGAPNRVIVEDNILAADNPTHWASAAVEGPHDLSNASSLFLLPHPQTTTDLQLDNLTSWDSLEVSPVSGTTVTVATSTDGGAQWVTLSPSGDLSALPTTNGSLRLQLSSSGDPWPTGALSLRLEELTLRWHGNEAPILALPQNQSALKWQPLTLMASGSDLDADPLGFSWEQRSGPVELFAPTSAPELTFTPNHSGSYELWLGTSDGAQATNGTFWLQVPNAPPQVSATGPSLSPKGQPMVVQANGSDPDGDPLTYQWSQLVGPATLLEGAENQTLTVHPSAGGVYRFSVQAFDNEGIASPPAEVEVTVTLAAPVAALAIAQPTVPLGTAVLLEGAGSSDSDGTVVGYLFDLGDGMAPTWGNSSRFSYVYEETGSFLASLTVRDDDGQSSASMTVIVEVVDAPVAPTVRIAVEPLQPFVGDAVELRALSDDVDGEVVGWLWSIDGEVSGSAAVVGFIFTTAGVHEVGVVVTDDSGLSANATTPLIVREAPNGPPELIEASPQPGLVLNVGQAVTLEVTVTDPESDLINYTWSLEGVLRPEREQTLLLRPSVVGVIHAQVLFTDGFHQSLIHQWVITVVDHPLPPRCSQSCGSSMLLAGVGIAAVAVVMVILLLRRRQQ